MRGTLLSLEPFYAPKSFSLKAVMTATPVAVLSFLGFDGISTLAEDSKDPQKNVGRATILVCFIAGLLFILQTYLGQLICSESEGTLVFTTGEAYARVP